jgi:AcrR family transcriptional regulator
MATTAVPAADTRTLILDAARSRLLADGYAGLSTRKVAEEAGVPLSQLHYHFGSKGGLIIALFEEQNERRLGRQRTMYAQVRPLWQRYEQACDYLEDDLDSGYVRVLQEMVAAGWSNHEIGAAARELLEGWHALLAEVVRETERRYGPIGPFTVSETATLVACAFFGSEALLLLGFGREALPIRSALRRVGVAIRRLEEGPPSGADDHLEGPGAVDALDPVELDVAGGAGAADPGLGAGRVEPGQGLGDAGHHLGGGHHHQVVVGDQAEGAAALAGAAVEHDRARLGDGHRAAGEHAVEAV